MFVIIENLIKNGMAVTLGRDPEGIDKEDIIISNNGHVIYSPDKADCFKEASRALWDMNDDGRGSFQCGNEKYFLENGKLVDQTKGKISTADDYKKYIESARKLTDPIKRADAFIALGAGLIKIGDEKKGCDLIKEAVSLLTKTNAFTASDLLTQAAFALKYDSPEKAIKETADLIVEKSKAVCAMAIGCFVQLLMVSKYYGAGKEDMGNELLKNTLSYVIEKGDAFTQRQVIVEGAHDVLLIPFGVAGRNLDIKDPIAVYKIFDKAASGIKDDSIREQTKGLLGNVLKIISE